MQRFREQNVKKLLTPSTVVILESMCRVRQAALGPISASRQRRQTSGRRCALLYTALHVNAV